MQLDVVIKNFTWRKNQNDAIDNTIAQNFKSGIYCQIMASGKSFIMLHLIEKHKMLYPNKNLYIITCFRQEILKNLLFDEYGNIDETKKLFLKNNNIINIDNFNVIDRVHIKNKKIILSKNKPSILIINNDFLRSLDNANKIPFNDINFVILDECHSVSAAQFYKLLYKIRYNYGISILGFSATPLRYGAEHKLVSIFCNIFNNKLNIISNYDYMSAIKDNIILPPTYILCEVTKTLNNKIGHNNKEIMKNMLIQVLKNAPYKKIVAWCRNIANMIIYYKYIKTNFPNIAVYCTSCNDIKLTKLGFNTNINEFYEKTNNAILICVNRCKEGSDIMNLDIVIYLDYVMRRSITVSMQTSGRVLRFDKKGLKKYGLIIDPFINDVNTSIESLTAHKIIGYYKQIFLLADQNDYIEQKNAYNEMIMICSNMTFDKTNDIVTIKIDNNENHNITIKLELVTKKYDFSKLQTEIAHIIDKMYNITRENKFSIIVDKIKNTNVMFLNTLDFWKEYDLIPDKPKLGLPINSDTLYAQFKDLFDKSNWYTMLDLDTSLWYNNITECNNAINKIWSGRVNQQVYYELIKIDKKLPPIPQQLYKSNGFFSIEHNFNAKKDVRFL